MREKLERAKRHHERALRNLRSIRGVLGRPNLSPEKRRKAQDLLERQKRLVAIAKNAVVAESQLSSPDDVFRLAWSCRYPVDMLDQDTPLAEALFRIAAQLRYRPACSTLGQLLWLGRNGKREPEEAVFWLSKATPDPSNSWYQQYHYREAQYYLGRAHWSGVGAPIDRKLALDELTIAATLGSASAAYSLSYVHRFGPPPFRDLKIGHHYLLQAALDDLRAGYEMGLRLELGRGVPRDAVKAFENYRRTGEIGVGLFSALSLFRGGYLMHCGIAGTGVEARENELWRKLVVLTGSAYRVIQDTLIPAIGRLRRQGYRQYVPLHRVNDIRDALDVDLERQAERPERVFLDPKSDRLGHIQLFRSAVEELKLKRYSLAADIVNEAIDAGLPQPFQKMAERLWRLIAAKGAPGSPRESPIRRIQRGNRWLAEIEKQVPEEEIVPPAKFALPDMQQIASNHLADLSRDVPRAEVNAATRSGLKVSGVYAIEIAATGRRYIGSAFDIGVRWRAHVWMLRRGKHWNQTLQLAFYENGLQALRFRIVEAVEDQWRLAEREEFHFSQNQNGQLLNARIVALRPDISWEEMLFFEYRERLQSVSANANTQSLDGHAIKNQVIRTIAESVLIERERRYPIVGKVLDDLTTEIKIALIRGQARVAARERQK